MKDKGIKSRSIEVKRYDPIWENKMSAIFYHLIIVVNKNKNCLEKDGAPSCYINFKTSFLDFRIKITKNQITFILVSLILNLDLFKSSNSLTHIKVICFDKICMQNVLLNRPVDVIAHRLERTER